MTSRPKSYEYRHQVCLEETNIVGNVYFAHYVGWQGRCRELFLRDHVPDVAAELGRTIVLVTTRVSCHYHRELAAFDEVILRMTVGALGPGRLTMNFRYTRPLPGGDEELVATGEQDIGAVARDGSRTVATLLPASLREALQPYLDPSMVPVEHGVPEWRQ